MANAIPDEASRKATQVQRRSDTEFVVTRMFDAPLRLVYRAWSDPDVFRRWWVPEGAGMSLLSCEMDVRTGGKYRLVFEHPAFDAPMAFFGTYQEVVPGERMVWTNEESDEVAVTTVLFEEAPGGTRVTYSERYATAAGLEDALAGSAQGLPVQFAQLDGLLAGTL